MTVGAAVAWTTVRQSGDGPVGSTVATSSIPGPPPESGPSQAEQPGDALESAVGVIRWTRHVGSRSTLPAAAVGQTEAGLIGRDDDGEVVWTSLDGLEWHRVDEPPAVRVGGRAWVVLDDDGRRRLAEVTAAGPVEVGVVERTEVASDAETSWEVVGAQPVVTELDGDVFARLDRREVGPASGASADATVERSAEWLRWDGERLVPVERPWSSSDRVEIAVLGERLLAVATYSERDGERAWTTTDGAAWTAIELPVAPSASSPIPLASGPDDVVLTIADGTTTSHWSTGDARSFERLENVPGIDERSKGTFGWVAPDPRSSPRLRVSADGVEWDVVDLSAHLGFDLARWDTRVEATAIGDDIYVVATRGDERTLLVGAVEAI